MDKVQLGSDLVTAETTASGVNRLAVVYSSSLSMFSQAFNWKGYPLTLYTDNKGHYSLAVIKETGTTGDDSFNYKCRKFRLRSMGTNRILSVKPVQESTDIYMTTMWRGMPIALNNNRNLILTDVGKLTVDQQEKMHVGAQPLMVRRCGYRWYLVVTED